MFSRLNENPILPDRLSHALERIARGAGLRGVGLHSLRHAHTSLMLRQGVHPKLVQGRLGYLTIYITLGTHSHVTPGQQGAAALAFDQELASSDPVPLSVR